MDTYIREQITNLRHTLHACPEISGQEKQTKETLQEFLKAHTSLELNDCGGGFYAAHREGAGNGIAFRAEHEKDLELLRETVWRTAKDLAGADGLGVEMEEQDVFPATENDPGCAAKVMERCNGKPLEVPMRWSEDFGHYLKKCKGAFFGIGAGEDHAALHTIHYEYPDKLLEHTAEVFLRLI